MKYIFSKRQLDLIKETLHVDLKDRPDVLVTDNRLPESVWMCKECDREYPAYHPRRCSCGSWSGFKIVEKDHSHMT